MTKISEKRKICREIADLKKALIRLDKKCPEDFDMDAGFLSYLCCANVDNCIFESALAALNNGENKLIAFQHGYQELIHLHTELLCLLKKYKTCCPDIDYDNEYVLLKSRFDCILALVYCGVKIFDENSTTNLNITPLINGLVCALKLDELPLNDTLFISYTADAPPTFADDWSLVGGSEVDTLITSLEGTSIPNLNKFLSIINSFIKQVEKMRDFVELKYDAKKSSVENYKAKVIEETEEKINSLCNTLELLNISCGGCNGGKCC